APPRSLPTSANSRHPECWHGASSETQNSLTFGALRQESPHKCRKWHSEAGGTANGRQSARPRQPNGGKTHMKIRLLAVAGGVAALGALGTIPALAAGANSGSCGTSAPTPSGTTATSPVDGAIVYANGSASGGSAGITGPHGYLDASGSPTSGGTIAGDQPDSGLNGSLTVGSSPSLCVGVSGAGGVSAP